MLARRVFYAPLGALAKTFKLKSNEMDGKLSFTRTVLL